jgi:serine/threonine protein kinase
MAEIYLARARLAGAVERLVVIKRVLPDLLADPRFVSMFLDEARTAALLQHANIVQVYDVGESDGTYFLAMEHLDGYDVRQLSGALTQLGRALPLEHALSIVIGACAGLHHAHEQRDIDGRPLEIVHRDVSPSNIFVTFDGTVKLVDFGIAKATQRMTETNSNTLKGKAPYMSPEQCRGAPLDRRSDIFSLAVVLWELLCGRRLFTGASDYVIFKAVVEFDAPTPSSVVAGLSAELDEIVARGLRRDRAARYATAREFQLALEGYAHRRGLPLSPIGLSAFLRELVGPADRRGGSDDDVLTQRDRPPRPIGTSEVSPTDEQRWTRSLGPTPPVRRRRWPAMLIVSLALGSAAGLAAWARGRAPGAEPPASHGAASAGVHVASQVPATTPARATELQPPPAMASTPVIVPAPASPPRASASRAAVRATQRAPARGPNNRRALSADHAAAQLDIDSVLPPRR